MARPSQLLLVAVVYALGVAIALAKGAAMDPIPVGAGLVALVPATAGVHYANEYADYETDSLTERTPFSGGSGALQEADLPRSLARDAAVAALAAAGLLAALLWVAAIVPPTAVVLLVVGTVFGVQYSLPPLAFSRHGLGEVANAVLGGIALPCFGAATLGGLSVEVALAVVPFALLDFVNLLETQWPDRYADADTGKDTLAVRLSPERLRWLYWLAAAAAFASLVPLAGSVLPLSVVVVTFATLPFFVWGSYRFTRRREPFPAVVGMVLAAVGQLVAWLYVVV